jgi:hypothetical protein
VIAGQANSNGRVPGKAVRAAAALAILFLISIAVNALTILADSNFRAPFSAAGDPRSPRSRPADWHDATEPRRGATRMIERAGVPKQ